MKQTLDTLIEESKNTLEEINTKIESSSIELSDDAIAFWADLKVSYEEIEAKLQESASEYSDKAEKSAYLSMMEAKHKLLDLQDMTERFTTEVLNVTGDKIEIAKYQAELAGFKADDTWENMKDDVAETYETSKDEVQKLAVVVGDEVKALFAKLKSLV